MTSSSAGFVAGLTAAALAGVGFLGYQTSADVPAGLGTPGASGSPPGAAAKPSRAERDRAALPAVSGAGERVVYALGGDRVWLVGRGNTVRRTFTVAPGSIDPAPGTYEVTSRLGSVTGTDGAPIEHVVLFTDVDGLPVGFSAAVDAAASPADPSVRTGGVRESRADGDAMWRFATVGAKVVVIG
ncbi:hypothetical protein M2271_001488 [Streptomyces sp. LBL]|uniref:hypothetical protein n=1 Tax=Streptomyces sp. LBL TaxID=2940562 RepID=UPI00247509D7|nr:hypothetical protein [Streptomyces sp. LBL]MDH6623696.1 hypothetical protein [Streptomyces sp. LBL]